MKMILGVALLVFSLSSIAASVKVTSFTYVRNQGDMTHPLAELCGLVEGAVSPVTFVRATIDPKSKNPAAYNTAVGQDGKFCMAVITYRGSAEVSIMGESASSVKAKIQ
jgi:hypothetical protein